MANAPKNIVDLTQEIVDYTKEKFWDKSSQKVAGAYNLLQNYTPTQESGGVTYTANSDGTITGTGNTDGSSFWLNNADWITLKPGTYKLIALKDADMQTYASIIFYAQAFINGSWREISWQMDKSTPNDNIHTFTEDTQVRFRFIARQNISNVVIKPMITLDLNATYDDYVPHAKTNKELTDESANKTDLTSIIATGSTNGTGSAIAAGTYFYLNGTLCKAKTSIASGATFTKNTNYEVVTVGDELKTTRDTLATDLILEHNGLMCVLQAAAAVVDSGRIVSNTFTIPAAYLPKIQVYGVCYIIDSGDNNSRKLGYVTVGTDGAINTRIIANGSISSYSGKAVFNIQWLR